MELEAVLGSAELCLCSLLEPGRGRCLQGTVGLPAASCTFLHPAVSSAGLLSACSRACQGGCVQCELGARLHELTPPLLFIRGGGNPPFAPYVLREEQSSAVRARLRSSTELLPPSPMRAGVGQLPRGAAPWEEVRRLQAPGGPEHCGQSDQA